MKRKMLISIALITIMLLNCMMPLLVVNADVSSGEEIQLNSKLYKAIRNALYKEGIVFECDDITRTITISPEEKARVVKLNLNECAISDISGIEAFSSLTHLELSGNNLTGESNLGVLNSLGALNYLDLSTNQIDEVDDISNLISGLQKYGTVILSGQTVTKVNSVFVDTEEESDQPSTATFELPGILELAGYLKSVWKDQKSYSEEVNPAESYFATPYIEKTPMYVTADDKLIEVTIADKDTGAGYYGMVKFSIYIYDDATEAAQANNPNKASENILNGSRFYLYYVVHDSKSEAITTMDTNLYTAIKEQLTGGQYGKYINPDLSSYPYVVDKDGNILYEEFTYTTQEIDGVKYRVLTNVDTEEVQYVIDIKTGTLYEYDGTTIGEVVETTVEPIEIKTADENGLLTIKAGYKVAFKGDDTGETLYEAAYDEAKTFVIDDLVLTNKITSLILNNRQIRDLSGIENFIGLNSELNVSHNYLSNIDPIYDLQKQKDFWEAQLVEKFTYWLKTRPYGNLAKSTNEVNVAKGNIKTEIEAIEKTTNLIFNALVDSATLDEGAESYQDDIKGKVDAVTNHLKSIYGYTEATGEEVDGNLDRIEDYLNGDTTKDIVGMNSEIDNMYNYLRTLYSIYNNKYKLTTFLADNINYLTWAEYEAYKEATEASKDSAFALLSSQIAYVNKLEAEGALSELDKMLLSYSFGINFDTDEPAPVAKYFDALLQNNAMNRITVVNYLNEFREIGLYSEMANYCLIKRMNNETAASYCYEQEYLENRIEEFQLEEIPVDLELEVLELIQNYDEAAKEAVEDETTPDEGTEDVVVPDEGTEDVVVPDEGTEDVVVPDEGTEDVVVPDEGTEDVVPEEVSAIEMTSLFDVYTNYTETVYEYTGTDAVEPIYMCSGEYKDLDGLQKEYTTYTDDEVLAKVLEMIENSSENTEEGEEAAEVNTAAVAEVLSRVSYLIINEVELYENVNSALSLANELHVYDQLMSLANKLINGNVQRYVTLPDLKKLDVSYNADLDNLEGLTVLQSLYDLNAAYCYIADVTNVAWEELTNLRKLNLGYNYISDISPITELTNLKYLNLSNNLIAGKLDISEYQYEKLFKKLEELDLSGNQITDITSLLIYLDYITNGNYANYIAKENTIDINLNNQRLTMEIERPINLSENPTTIDVELPRIFTQLLAIDTERTAFGETSQDGRIESEGTYVTLNTRTVGDKIGEVVVIPMSGNGKPVDTCVGDGTTLTIKYKVVAEKVTAVTVTPNENVEIKPGYTQQFKANVEGEDLLSKDVVWSVEGAQNEGTTISETGLLTVAEEETAEKVTVKATPKADSKMATSVEVTIVTTPDEGNEGTETPGEGNEGTETPGEGNEGTETPGEGNEGTETPGEGNEGTETPGEGNEGTETPDKGDQGTTEPEVDVIDTATLGYTVGEEYLTKVSPKTPIEDFKTILLNGKEYNVVIKKDGETVTDGNVTTGMFVQVQDENGNLIKDQNGDYVVYEIIVNGDVNGDGLANSLDSMLIKAYRNEVTDLTGSANVAADINDDGKVNLADSKLLLYHRAEVTGYNLNYTK